LKADKKGKSVSLVLGSGGARGLAHIGIIDWLEAQGFEIRSIAGSSMGALVGGIYAAGELQTYARWVCALEQMDVVRLLDFSFGKSGLLRGERVMQVLKELIGDRRIEELPISFTAVATNVEDQREVWLNRGSLFDAIRASIAIPTVFTPVQYRGKALLDGGLINPVPIAPTLRDKTDITVAVSLSGKPDPAFDQPPKRAPRSRERESYRRKIGQFLEQVQQKLGLDEEEGDDMSLFEVVSSSIETMQNTIARFQLAAYTPDVIIELPRNACTFYEFYRAEEMIELGRSRAKQTLSAYR